MLTVEMIQFLLEELSYRTVSLMPLTEGTEIVHYRRQKKELGYAEGIRGTTQVALSVMLEAKSKKAVR